MIEARSSLPIDVQYPVLVKIAPDLTEVDKEDIAAVVTRKQVCFVLFWPRWLCPFKLWKFRV